MEKIVYKPILYISVQSVYSVVVC